MIHTEAKHNVAKYPFNILEINGVLRSILGSSASLLENSPPYPQDERYVFVGQPPTPSYLMVFADEEGPKSVALFVLGHTDQDGSLRLAYRDIEAVEQWFQMQKEGAGKSLDDTAVWYLVPPGNGTPSEVGGFFTHAFVLETMLEECRAIGATDSLGSLAVPLESAVGFEFLNKENVSRAGWLNHTFIEPPPPRRVEPEMFYFPELAVIDRFGDDQFVF